MVSAMRDWLKRISKFHRIPWKMKIMFFIAYMLMGLVRMCVLLLPFRFIAPILGQKNQTSSLEVSRDTLTKATKIGYIVNTSSRFTPWESKCLVRAITAILLLRLLRIPCTLYLGMGKDASNKLIAHAWLRCGEVIITGAEESMNFKSVINFASHTSL